MIFSILIQSCQSRIDHLRDQKDLIKYAIAIRIESDFSASAVFISNTENWVGFCGFHASLGKMKRFAFKLRSEGVIVILSQF